MRLIANKISPDWPLGAARGIVHSVHDRALNIKIGSYGLHSVVDEAKFGEQARVVYVKLPIRFCFSNIITANRSVFLNAEFMVFERSVLFLDLASVNVMQFVQEQRVNKIISVGSYVQSWLAAWDFLINYEGPKGFIPGRTTKTSGMFLYAVADYFWGNLPTLLKSIRARDLKSSIEDASRYRGLGLGYTPSGDDFLTGLLIGANFAAASEGDKDFVRRFSAELLQEPWLENELVGKFRRDSVDGRPNLLLYDVCSSIAGGTMGAKLEDTIRNALRCGNTSGWDTVLGLLSGLSLLCGELTSRIEMYSHQNGWQEGSDRRC